MKNSKAVSSEQLDKLLDEAETHLSTTFNYTHAENIANEVLMLLPKYSKGKQSLQITAKIREARALCIIGYCAINTAHFDTALSSCTKALGHAKQTANLSMQARALNGMAMAQRNRVDHRVVLNLAEQALALAEEAQDIVQQRKALTTIGNVHGEITADYPKALDSLGRALALAEEQGDTLAMEGSLGGIGNIYYNLADYPRALDYHSRALTIAEEIGNKAGISRHLGNIGEVYVMFADYPQALDFYTRSLAVAEETGNKRSIGISLGRLAGLYNTLNNFQLSLDTFNRALALAEELGNKTQVAIYRGNVGLTYKKMGDYEQALECFKYALKLSLSIGAVRPAGYWMLHAASIEHLLGNLDEAYKGCLEALHHRREIVKSNEGVAETLLQLATVLFDQGKTEEALLRQKEALALAQSSFQKKMILNAHKEISITLSQIGDAEHALEHLKKYIELNQEIFNEESRINIEKINIRLAVSEKEKEAEIQKIKAQHLEKEMKRHEDELSNKTLQLVQQTDMLLTLRHDLDGIVRHADTAEKAVRSIREKLKEIPEHLLNWEKFSEDFRKVHPNFENNLKNKYPELSKTEIKVCCLLRIGMSTREISTILFLSERTVEIHRQHIRKKLLIPVKTEINLILSAI